mgnify:CR=1 FL=1
MISDYEDELRNIFVAYAIENYWAQKKNKRLLLSFREILLQNKKCSLFFFLLLFQIADFGGEGNLFAPITIVFLKRFPEIM